MDDEVYELLWKAWDELRAGNYEEVDLLFDRILNCKWCHETECDGEYRMFSPDGAICQQHNFFAHALGLQVAVHCAGAE